MVPVIAAVQLVSSAAAEQNVDPRAPFEPIVPTRTAENVRSGTALEAVVERAPEEDLDPAYQLANRTDLDCADGQVGPDASRIDPLSNSYWVVSASPGPPWRRSRPGPPSTTSSALPPLSSSSPSRPSSRLGVSPTPSWP